MKISILSMQNIDNYGSVLQAYSLKKIVEGLGHNVSFIDIIPENNEQLNMECSKLAIESGLSVKWLKPNLFKRLKNKLKRIPSERMYRSFRKYKLEIKGDCSKDHYDACIIGSDEVFNCIQVSKWGFDSQLYGNIKIADKVITYAASCGATKETMLTSSLRESIKNSFSHVSQFSVRDKNTQDFVVKLTGRKPIINMDPVAVGNFDEEINKSQLPKKMPKHYCIVYSYKERFCDEKTIRSIQDFCQKHELIPVALFGSQLWTKNDILLTPFEVLKAFQEADFIITDTFHGALFGAKYAKKIVVFIRDSNKNKLSDLVCKLQMEKHVVLDASEIEDKFNVLLDRNEIDIILKKERERTIDYLKKNL